jgi:hypothetical protein
LNSADQAWPVASSFSTTRCVRRGLSKWPLPQPRAWTDLVNQPQSEGELEAIRRSVTRSQPYGSEEWVQATAKHLGLESILRVRGRPPVPMIHNGFADKDLDDDD